MTYVKGGGLFDHARRAYEDDIKIRGPFELEFILPHPAAEHCRYRAYTGPEMKV
jgi:hypothetical protein